MNAVKFHAVIGEDRVIRLPAEVEVPPGPVEVTVVQNAAPPHSAWLGCVQLTASWHFISVRLQISPVKHSTVRMHMRPEPPASIIIPPSPPPVTLPLQALARSTTRPNRSHVIPK